MTVRAKFMLTEVRQHQWSAEARTLVFEPRYDTTIPEDQRFNTATPTGRFEMLVNNPPALAAFEIGKQYYLDIAPVPESVTA
jgi:hypothetical protein